MNADSSRVAYYYKNKNCIRAESLAEKSGELIYKELPNNTKYVRVSCLTSNKEGLIVRNENVYKVLANNNNIPTHTNVADKISYIDGAYISAGGYIYKLDTYQYSELIPLFKDEKSLLIL